MNTTQIFTSHGSARPGAIQTPGRPLHHRTSTVARLLPVAACVLATSTPCVAQLTIRQEDVVTYHNDAQRTGWNPTESTLTPANVTPPTFGYLSQCILPDPFDQVDAQPLVVTNQPIAGYAPRTVVYVVTQADNVYAIDSESGAILKRVNLGRPVPAPFGCTENAPVIGITSTPTIDRERREMYVMAYTLISGKPTYQLHALDLSTLSDKQTPATITDHNTSNSGFIFDPAVQRQRPALLEARGNIYAAFGSFCDTPPARGWLLGWDAKTLAPLQHNELTNTRAAAPNTQSLASIWMSGYGVAAAPPPQEDLFFVTGNGNSYTKADTYTGTTNIQESVVRISPDLSHVVDLFTPFYSFPLDKLDWDLGSGGALVLPDQPGPFPRLVVAAGKEGRLFIVNRDDMGKRHYPDIPESVDIQQCLGGQSYFKGSDGVGRVVSSGLYQVQTWTPGTTTRMIDGKPRTVPTLNHEASAPPLANWGSPQTDQQGGFFTSISSYYTRPNTAIIWAVGRALGNDQHVTLYAFDGTASSGTLKPLWSGTAGFWPYVTCDANLVPTVANGRVYAASFRRLAIFGLGGRGGIPLASGVGIYWGTIENINGARIGIRLRTKKLLQVDLTQALKEGTAIDPGGGENVVVTGTDFISRGVLKAQTMARAEKLHDPNHPEPWGQDHPVPTLLPPPP